MSDTRCDVCRSRPMVGVASMSAPMSIAYCAECAQAGADPEWYFSYLLEDVAGGDPTRIRSGLVTWKDGKFVSFHDWASLPR